MPAARTTDALIARAISAAKAAGLEIAEIVVEQGGRVRIVARGGETAQPAAQGGGSCEGKFGRAP